MMHLLSGQLSREFLLVSRVRTDVLNPLIFLLLSVTLFALALEGRPEILRVHAPAVLWTLVLLTNMLALDGVFRRDFDDGVLEQLFLQADAPWIAILGKLIVHWLVTGFAMVVCIPLFGLALYLPAEVLPVLMLALLLGTPTITCLGAIGAALTVGLRRGGAILALLVLPLLIPVLIFGVSAVNRVMDGEPALAELYWLAALSLASITSAPFAVGSALRISLEQ